MVIDTRKQVKIFQGCFGSCTHEECSHIGDIVVTNRGIEKVIKTSDLLK